MKRHFVDSGPKLELVARLRCKLYIAEHETEHGETFVFLLKKYSFRIREEEIAVFLSMMERVVRARIVK